MRYHAPVSGYPVHAEFDAPPFSVVSVGELAEDFPGWAGTYALHRSVGTGAVFLQPRAFVFMFSNGVEEIRRTNVKNKELHGFFRALAPRELSPDELRALLEELL